MEYQNIRKAKPGDRIKQVILTGLALLTFAGLSYMVGQNEKKKEAEYESKLKSYNKKVEYNAVYGDTFWDLAARYGPKDVPIERRYQYLMELNNKTSYIINSGENLRIPSGKSWKNLEDKVKKSK